MEWHYALAAVALVFVWYLVVLSRKKKKEKRDWRQKWFIEKKVRPSVASKKAPVKGVCGFCAAQVTMPFRCKFCGGVFCDQHRMPENHSCPGLRSLRREGRKPPL